MRPSTLACLARALLLLAAAGCAVAPLPPRLGPPEPFSFEALTERARSLAGEPYRPPPRPAVPEESHITYNEHRLINYRPEREVWRQEKLPFRLRFYPCGYRFPEPVRVRLVAEGAAREVLHEPGLFDFREESVARKAALTPGLAGFRILCPLNGPRPRDEALSFLGASYFRAIGRGGVMGLSARGLAVDIALAEPEEFPRFTEFWVERPRRDAAALRVFALLDSPSVAGAYRFDLRPGEDTVIPVEARLFFRRAPRKLGVAPLTSMFFYGENDPPVHPDPRARPEVHDSDGFLLRQETGEWLWRPARNPARARVSSFRVGRLALFGLLQRDRGKAHYLDEGAFMERRVNAWVEPVDAWEGGAVHFFELPTPDETNDNLNAFWVWDQPPDAGKELRLRYRLHFSLREPPGHTGAKAVETRRRATEGAVWQYEILFRGGPLNGLGAGETIEPVVTAEGGAVANARAHRQPDGGCRVTFDLTAGRETVELRVFLRHGADTLSETWSELWER